jgi:hypothetical protein
VIQKMTETPVLATTIAAMIRQGTIVSAIATPFITPTPTTRYTFWLPATSERFGDLRPLTELTILMKIAPTFCNALNALPVLGFDTNKTDYITKTLRWAVNEDAKSNLPLHFKDARDFDVLGEIFLARYKAMGSRLNGIVPTTGKPPGFWSQGVWSPNQFYCQTLNVTVHSGFTSGQLEEGFQILDNGTLDATITLTNGPTARLFDILEYQCRKGVKLPVFGGEWALEGFALAPVEVGGCEKKRARRGASTTPVSDAASEPVASLASIVP